MTIKQTTAVTASVANTAKRVIVMLYMAAATGQVLMDEQKVGAAVAIGGVLAYSVVDDVLKAKPKVEMRGDPRGKLDGGFKNNAHAKAKAQ